MYIVGKPMYIVSKPICIQTCTNIETSEHEFQFYEFTDVAARSRVSKAYYMYCTHSNDLKQCTQIIVSHKISTIASKWHPLLPELVDLVHCCMSELGVF